MIHHVFEKGTSKDVMILLHGTGGNERDLLQLSNYISKEATKIGIRGRILESGMPRYFKRLSPGVFDLENLIEETHWLYQTIVELLDQYELKQYNIHVLGYSNGANIASAINFFYPTLFRTSILFHPMKPFEQFDYPELHSQHIFIGAGKNDPIVSQQQTFDLATIYQKHGAEVEVFWSHSGHQITQQAILEAHQFFNKKNT
jgi:phospholipase/carboxylesterase